MIAMDDTRIETSLRPRPSRAAALSVGLHLLVVSAWLLAPLPKPDDMGTGALTVQLLMEPPPPAPEPPPRPEPQPQPQPEPAKPQPTPEAPKPKPAPRPATKPAPVAASQPAQAAAPPAASGPVTSAPAETAEPSAPAANAVAIGNPAARQAERDDYLRMVWARIMRFRPERVTLRGTTRLRFTLAADGSLLHAEVAESSGSGLLDRAALNAVQRAAPFPPPPAGGDGDLSFVIPFQFRPAG